MKDIQEKVDFMKKNIYLIEDFSRDILFSLEKIITEIRYETDTDKINSKFELLQSILIYLEQILWIDTINFNKKLYKIARDFDRIDDLDTRMYLTKKIKEWLYE